MKEKKEYVLIMVQRRNKNTAKMFEWCEHIIEQKSQNDWWRNWKSWNERKKRICFNNGTKEEQKYCKNVLSDVSTSLNKNHKTIDEEIEKVEMKEKKEYVLIMVQRRNKNTAKMFEWCEHIIEQKSQNDWWRNWKSWNERKKRICFNNGTKEEQKYCKNVWVMWAHHWNKNHKTIDEEIEKVEMKEKKEYVLIMVQRRNKNTAKMFEWCEHIIEQKSQNDWWRNWKSWNERKKRICFNNGTKEEQKYCKNVEWCEHIIEQKSQNDWWRNWKSWNERKKRICFNNGTKEEQKYCKNVWVMWAHHWTKITKRLMKKLKKLKWKKKKNMF